MGQDKCNLAWQNYTDHLREMLNELLESNELTDVTVVSEDSKQFKAHKVVLCASSLVFKNILCYGSFSNPILYLRGIQSHEIESILQFIYLGKVTLHQDSMNEFLYVAKSLEIKEISKENAVDKEFENEKFQQSIELSKSNIVQEHIKEDSVIKQMQNNSVYACEQCDNQNRCNFIADRLSNLNRHKSSVHEGIKYPCDQCNNQFTRKFHLKEHVKSVHKGVRYPCDQCTFKAARLRNLNRHISTVHEGIRYPCDQCNQQFTHTFQLHKHVKSVHE